MTNYYDSPSTPPPPPHGQPYYGPPRGTNGFAIAALVLGIVGLCGCLGILGLIFGNVAKNRIAETGESGEGLAQAGIVLGWISVAGTAIQAFLILSGSHPYFG